MNRKKGLFILMGLTAGFTFLMCRMYLLMTKDNAEITAIVRAQQTRTTVLYENRGNFYDCNLNLLTNYEEVVAALVNPLAVTEKEALLAACFDEWRETAERGLGSYRTFYVELEKDIELEGVYTYTIPKRYGRSPIAVNTIGYLTAQGGALGLELACNDFLKADSRYEIKIGVDAVGRMLNGQGPLTLGSSVMNKAGVVLTLDKDIQKAAEKALGKSAYNGATIVIDIYSGEIKAMASKPTYDPYNVSAASGEIGRAHV